MRFTIKPSTGLTEMTFFCPDSGGYVRLENGQKIGTFGRQICYGGGFMGATITANDRVEFVAECRKWYRQFSLIP